MTPVLLILAVLLQFHCIRGQIPDTIMPQRNQFCDYDAFISSRPINNKVFLHPWKISDRKGDWFQARGYCAQHCAEIVTIDSSEENDHFTAFMRGIAMDDFTWIGAQVYSLQEFTTWSNGSPAPYHNKAPGEYNEVGVVSWTCANTFYSPNKYFYNYFCNYPNYLVACQRPASWTICSNGQ